MKNTLLRHLTFFIVIILFFPNGCSQENPKKEYSSSDAISEGIFNVNTEDTTKPKINHYPTNINIELGVPTDADSTDDYLIFRTQYVLSYNPNLHNANWVSWNLNSEWFGEAERYNKFIQDTELPSSIYQPKDKDYSGSGYDKGHTVRSEERTANVEDNITTFYYTNVMPQTPDLYRGVWLKFERYCEKLCKNENKELFIIAGGIYHEGYSTLGNDIAIPDSCFKIVVVLNKGEKIK